MVGVLSSIDKGSANDRAFVAIRMKPRVTDHGIPTVAVSDEEAVASVESWLERPNVRIIEPGPRHAELLFGFLRAEGKAGNLTTDAHLAALSVESRAVIHTADTDFLRFSGVRWHNPLN